MKFKPQDWIDELAFNIKNEFGDTLNFIGLQGSYKRNEANIDSDIDIVVILNQLTMQHLNQYRRILSLLPEHEKACGFISGYQEIINWEKSELFQFYYDTKPIYGTLDYLLPLFRKEDVARAIKIGACNLYHSCCHNYIYDKSAEILSALYKSAFFILLAKYFDETGQYIESRADLLECLDGGADKEILKISNNRKTLRMLNEAELEQYYDKMLAWSSNLLQSY